MNSLTGDYRIVHFAAHGFVNTDHPELSGIILSQIDRSGKGINGFVPVRDIYNLNLSADLVVLSACDTALGKDIKGEGLVGLTHGFLASGSKSVVASLWKVDDRATSVLMANFYKSMLQDGLTPAAALRSAKEQVRRQKGWQAPYYWAGFVLQGEYNHRIAVNRRSAYRPALAVIFICALGLPGAILVRRHWRRMARPAV
jgi:CHAT domain-containing protein